MLTRIHVNRHIIASNKRKGSREAPLSVVDYKQNRKGHTVELTGPGRVVYSPEKPLKCGATVWIETEHEVLVS